MPVNSFRVDPIARVVQALASAAVCIAPLSVAHAFSQESARLEEVVVTAQRREESIQDVPIAISALDAESLRRQNIASAYDLLGKVPSLIVTSHGNPRNAEAVTIRGQGATYLAPVGVVNYFAEVPMIQSGIIANQGGPGTFFDVGSLQVLRGPRVPSSAATRRGVPCCWGRSDPARLCTGTCSCRVATMMTANSRAF